jgi:hypothetical protein
MADAVQGPSQDPRSSLIFDWNRLDDFAFRHKPTLELNDELNVAVFDPKLAERLLADVERDITRSRRLDLQSWRARPLHIRAREQFWSFFGEVF